jgi:metal-sulfur cluster biosynthetic enzyme
LSAVGGTGSFPPQNCRYQCRHNRKALRAVKDPELNLNIDIGLVYDITVSDG